MEIVYPGSTIFQSDFESGLEGWKQSDFDHPSSGIVPNPNQNDQISGNSAKFVLEDPDKREELSLEPVPYNSEITYNFRIFLPESYVNDPAPEILAQWHAVPDFDLGETWSRTGPVLALLTVDGKWTVGHQWDSREIIREQGQQGHIEVEGSENYDLGDYQTGVWTDWTFHVRWSYEADGLVEVWQDNNLVVRETGPNAYNDQIGPYLKVGLYNKKWQDSSLTQRELYYDDVEVLAVEEEDYLLRDGGEDNTYVLNSQTAPASQIQDRGGTDSLIFSDLSVGIADLQRENNDLLLDINQDGVFEPVNDLRISDFFTSSGVGDGFIETVGNLDGNEIFDAFSTEAVLPVAIEAENI